MQFPTKVGGLSLKTVQLPDCTADRDVGDKVEACIVIRLRLFCPGITILQSGLLRPSLPSGGFLLQGEVGD